MKVVLPVWLASVLGVIGPVFQARGVEPEGPKEIIIEGIVYDATGKPVPGADITFVRSEKTIVIKAGRDGSYKASMNHSEADVCAIVIIGRSDGSLRNVIYHHLSLARDQKITVRLPGRPRSAQEANAQLQTFQDLAALTVGLQGEGKDEIVRYLVRSTGRIEEEAEPYVNDAVFGKMILFSKANWNGPLKKK